jgi:hypothetical protein
MDLFRRGLKIESGALHGKRFLRSWARIEPEDITDIRTYCWNNPFLKVWTRKGSFVLGARAKGYEEVGQYIDEHTRFSLSETYAHKYNMVLYRLPLSDIARYLFGRKRTKGNEKSV